jgi:hypothetical protein
MLEFEFVTVSIPSNGLRQARSQCNSGKSNMQETQQAWPEDGQELGLAHNWVVLAAGLQEQLWHQAQARQSVEWSVELLEGSPVMSAARWQQRRRPIGLLIVFTPQELPSLIPQRLLGMAFVIQHTLRLKDWGVRGNGRGADKNFFHSPRQIPSA